MVKAEIEKMVKGLIGKYSFLGEVTDVWLNPYVMEVLDSRPPHERISEPYKIGPVWVSAFSDLQEDEVRVAFRTKIGTEE